MSLRPIKREVLENGHIQITVEEKSLFGLIKTKTTFTSDRKIVGKFRNWLSEPNKMIVPDHLSFQLDEWNDVLS